MNTYSFCLLRLSRFFIIFFTAIMNIKYIAFITLLLATFASAGLLSYGICQSGCNCVAVACYAAAGYTFGTVTAGLGIPASLVACNAALGTCMASCVAAGCIPFIP